VPGILGLAALAGGVRLPPLCERRGVAAGGLAVEVRRLRPEGVRDGGHDLRQDPYAADGVVRYGLADGRGQGRGLGDPGAAGDGAGLLPDGVGDAAPLPLGDGAPGSCPLRGDVEVDESFLGGPEPGVPGRGALGKVLLAGAVELDQDRFGRARLGVIPDASAVSLSAFLDANVEPGSRVITDGWSAYPAATRDRYEHTGNSAADSGLAAHEALPTVHRVFSLMKGWLTGTMQGSVSPEHLQAYCDEWVFRFNRRNARSRGLLFHTLLRQAVEGQPVSYRSLRKAGRTRPAPQPARGARRLPPSLDMGRPEL